jgi:hypothetical protein
MVLYQISPYYGKNNSNKQRETTVIITLTYEDQSMGNISRVQLQKPSSAMMKLALMRTATGTEDT